MLLLGKGMLIPHIKLPLLYPDRQRVQLSGALRATVSYMSAARCWNLQLFECAPEVRLEAESAAGYGSE